MVPARMPAFSLCQLPPRRVPLSMPEERKEGGLPVMTSNTGLANLAIEQVLELSADAHIERRMTAQDSAAFTVLRERSWPMEERSRCLWPSKSEKSFSP